METTTFKTNTAILPSFWFMKDNHTFISLKGTNIYEVMSDAKKVSKMNPYGSVCPVTLLDGETEKKNRHNGSCG